MNKNLASRLTAIATSVAETVARKDVEYGGSWKQRGGVGAFMMLARKWDRIENQSKNRGYNIFHAIAATDRKEGVADDIDDLIGYLLLVRDEVMSQLAACEPGRNYVDPDSAIISEEDRSAVIDEAIAFEQNRVKPERLQTQGEVYSDRS